MSNDPAEVAAGPIPAKAEFHVAPYVDGSGARLTVKYDTTPARDGRNLIWIETGYGGNWIAIEPDIVDDVCAAIQAASLAVRAHLENPHAE